MARYRRRRNTSYGAPYASTNATVEQYIRIKIGAWLYAAFEERMVVDSEFFGCLSYVHGGLSFLLEPLASALGERNARTMHSALRPLNGRKRSMIRDEIASTSVKRQSSMLGEMWDEYPELQSFMTNELREAYERKEGRVIPRGVRKTQESIVNYFGCSGSMLDFLEFVHVLRAVSPVEEYFEDSLSIHERQNHATLARMLDISIGEVRELLHEAYMCGFMEYEMGEAFHMSGLMEKFWYADGNMDSALMQDLLYVQVAGKELPLEHFHIPDDDMQHTTSLLQSKGVQPLHLLLYGGAGTGKTSFAHSLAAALGIKAWSVTSRADDSTSDRRAALIACTRLAAKNPGSFVLVDEAEQLLDTDYTGFQRAKDKAWLNAFLEKEGQRIIWITNHIRHIDHAVRRRFAFSIHFEPLTEEQREYAWTQIVKDAKVTRRITKDELKPLVQRYDVPVAVVSKAVRQAKMLKAGKGDFAKAVAIILEAHVTLAHNGKQQKYDRVDEDAKDYCLDGVTLAQGAQHGIESIMQKVRKIDAFMQDEELPKGGGSMLFYGPPGTGKSALAKYMAHELDRKCVIKKASDLLGSLVGESEQNIARAFKDAEDNGHILVIDEADTFIFSRESAVRSWESSMVNEFLTQLEAFRGICICTTNRRESMDKAAMRRFSFKVPFAYAGVAQVEALYASILAPLCANSLTKAEKHALRALTTLAPGDFAAVRSQFWLEDDICHEALIKALHNEQKAKLDNVGKVVGFSS